MTYHNHQNTLFGKIYSGLYKRPLPKSWLWLVEALFGIRSLLLNEGLLPGHPRVCKLTALRDLVWPLVYLLFWGSRRRRPRGGDSNPEAHFQRTSAEDCEDCRRPGCLGPSLLTPALAVGIRMVRPSWECGSPTYCWP